MVDRKNKSMGDCVQICCFFIFLLIAIPTVSSDTITIQPGPIDGKDAFIYEFTSGTNYGSSGHLRVGSVSAGNMVSFLQFSLDSIPSDSTINSATLYLYCYYTSGSAQTIKLWQLASSWSESSVKWSDAPSYYNNRVVVK